MVRKTPAATLLVPDFGVPRKRDRSARFWDFVLPEPNTGCWIYFGGSNRNGRGFFHVGNTQVQAIRFCYEQIKGPIPDECELVAGCGALWCINPDHVEVVSHSEALKRAVSRGVVFREPPPFCKNGHQMVEGSFYPHRRKGRATYRFCKACNEIYKARARDRKRAKETT